MSLTITLPRQSWIVGPSFNHVLTVEIGQPSLDVPGGNEDRYTVLVGAHFDARFAAGVSKLLQTNGGPLGVPIDQYYERLTDRSGTVGLELQWKPLPDELLSRSSASGPLHPDSAGFPTHLVQEPASEDLVLLVLAEQDQLNAPAHNSQPLAMISESLSPPSSGISLNLRVVVLPVLSRFSRTPASFPR